jgi:hypothetical protein
VNVWPALKVFLIMTVPAMFSPFFFILAKGKSALQPYFDFPDFDFGADFS